MSTHWYNLFLPHANAPPSSPPAVAALNALAAALWGAVLAPVVYPLGADLGLWHELARPASTCGDQPADFLMVGAAVVGVQWRFSRGRAFEAVAVDLLRFFLALTLLGYGFSKV